MKVITEKELIEHRNNLLRQDKNIAACLVNDLIGEFKEIDTLTVSKLRPMCDEPEIPSGKFSVHVLVYFMDMSTPSIKRVDLHNGFDSDAMRNGIGWIPIPTYKPELTGDGE